MTVALPESASAIETLVARADFCSAPVERWMPRAQCEGGQGRRSGSHRPDQEWHRWDGPYFPKLDGPQIDAVCARLSGAIEDGSYAAQSPLRRAAIATVAEPATMIGSLSWHWESEDSDWRRMGLTVYDPALRGRGIGTNALTVWTDYLFRTTGVVRLDYSTWSGNERMLAVGRRLGFTEEACFRDAREVRGRRYDSVVMGALRREWEARGEQAVTG